MSTKKRANPRSVSFHFKWQQTPTKKISSLEFTVDLIWVRPDKRGLGGIAARHITSHLMFYLMDCKLIPPYVSAKGVNVTHYAEWYSRGGEKITYIVDENLMYMKESNLWAIRELEFEGGY